MPKLAVTEGPGKRVAVLARVTPTVREGLEVAAGVSGRSLSLEIETRLQDSIARDAEADHESAQLGRFMVAALALAERRLGRAWHSDKAAASYCFDRLKAALAEAMAVDVEMPGNKLQQAADPDVTVARVLAAQDNRAAAAAAPPISDEARAPWEPATPEEVAGMVDAPGLLPPEIGDRAAFDDAVSGLPLVKAEKAEQQAGAGWKPILKGRGARVMSEVQEPRPVDMPKRGRRLKV